ncbi:MAG: hypothetical protein QM811_17345 [Pirellulales bacterium]
MTLERLLLNKPFRRVQYPCGHGILLIEQGHPFIERDLKQGRCSVVEKGNVNDQLIDRISNDGWIFKTADMLIRRDPVKPR